MRATFLAVALAGITTACVSPQASAPQSNTTTSPTAPFTPTEGKTTSAEILANFGKPSHEDYNPDGRFIYQYWKKDGHIIVFLFDKNKILIRIKGYKDSLAK